jgi:hypothetical protein
MKRVGWFGLIVIAACGKDPVESDTDEIIVEYADADADGFNELVDCDDNNARINPDAREVCDEVDNDCDGAIDDDDGDVSGAPRWHRDDDRDGYGAQFDTTEACQQPSRYVEDGTDCDDTSAAVNPGAEEACGNGIDDDCDGATDAGKWYFDEDGDGYGSEADAPSTDCEQPPNTVEIRKDCDDTRADVNPDEREICGDDVDQDCDGNAQLCEFGPDQCDVYYMLGGNPTGADPSADAFGTAFAAGDFDGDGTADLAIGAPSAADPFTGAYTAPGRVYLFGGGAPADRVLKTTEHTSSTIAASEASGFGASLASVGDVSGDGRTDLAIGAPTAGANGAVYLFSDPSGELSASAARTTFTTDTVEQLGVRVDGGSDLDGDGTPDVVASAWLRPVGSVYGRVYALDGAVTGSNSAATAALFAVDAPATFTTLYTTYSALGWSVSSVGDVDGDGLGDTIIGAPTWGSDQPYGRAYLFSGDTTGVVDADAASAIYVGGAAGGLGELLGMTAARLGDVDGDGNADFGLGAIYNSAVNYQGGAVHVITGGDTGVVTASDATYLSVYGDSGAQTLGQGVANGGDIDGDGRTDLVVGSPNAVAPDGSWAGAAYAILDVAGHTATISVSDADLKFYDNRSPGAAGLGTAIYASDDVTGDGRDDLILSTPAVSTITPDGTNTGVAFLFTTF